MNGKPNRKCRSVLGIPLILALPLFISSQNPASLAAQPETSAPVIITVTTVEDELNNDGDCALREAIQAANTDSAVDACVAGNGDDTVSLPTGRYTLSLAGAGEDDNLTGDLDVLDNLVLQAEVDTVIDGNQLDRVLHVHDGHSLSTTNVTFTAGRAPAAVASNCSPDAIESCSGAHGGGVFNKGVLWLESCSVIGNEAGSGGDTSGATGGHGGGIFNTGKLTLTMTTVRENRSGSGYDNNSGEDCGSVASGGHGGGIANSSTGIITAVDLLVETNATGNGSFCTVGPVPPEGNGGDGGGIFNAGQMVIAGSELRTNRTSGATSGSGGGLFNSGTITLTESTVASNSTGDAGGGGSIHGRGYDAGNGGGLFNSGRLIVEASTVHANRTGNGGDGACGGPGRGGMGGGIANFSEIALVNSTISGNRTGAGGIGGCDQDELGAGGHGGGVFNGSGAVMDLDNVTVTANATGSPDGGGGGIASEIHSVRVKNGIFADNTAAGSGPECRGSIYSAGFNLFLNTDGCTILGNTASNLVGLSPQLASLTDNGGPTWTHALYFTSPAIDTGSCTTIDGEPIVRDQRRAVRPQIDNCDMGAYEASPIEIWRVHLPMIRG